jgi:hypothetical protein
MSKLFYYLIKCIFCFIESNFSIIYFSLLKWACRSIALCNILSNNISLCTQKSRSILSPYLMIFFVLLASLASRRDIWHKAFPSQNFRVLGRGIANQTTLSSKFIVLLMGFWSNKTKEPKQDSQNRLRLLMPVNVVLYFTVLYVFCACNFQVQFSLIDILSLTFMTIHELVVITSRSFPHITKYNRKINQLSSLLSNHLK